MFVDKETQETNLGNQDVDKDVADILSDKLTESQRHKESDDYIHENVEVDTAMGYGDVVNTHDHAWEDVENNVSDNINDVVNDFVSADEGYILWTMKFMRGLN